MLPSSYNIVPMKALKIIGFILLFITLTALSQIGGIILILWVLIFRVVSKRFTNEWARRGINTGGFVVFYLFCMFLIVPPLARIQDRVPLPISKSGALVPVTYWTAIFGRNYIKSEGRAKLETIAESFAKIHPELKVKYMDCNYPFRINVSWSESNTWILEGLLPHITHDGNKIDIALVYNDEFGKATNQTPTAIGYGSSVEPLPTEYCTPCYCKTIGKWQYSFMYNVLPKNAYPLNKNASRDLIKTFDKYLPYPIFIEKHLQQRFNLVGNYAEAGCKSVRHDDHFHVQLSK